MKQTGRLFEMPLGYHEDVYPEAGETVASLYKRLKRLARFYSHKWARQFRVEQKENCVLWWRVEAGQHSKLARWYHIAPGESFVAALSASQEDLKKAKATARYLSRKGAGKFEVRLENGEVTVQRISAPAAPKERQKKPLTAGGHQPIS